MFYGRFVHVVPAVLNIQTEYLARSKLKRERKGCEPSGECVILHQDNNLC